jgi:hypothetical protein
MREKVPERVAVAIHSRKAAEPGPVVLRGTALLEDSLPMQDLREKICCRCHMHLFPEPLTIQEGL